MPLRFAWCSLLMSWSIVSCRHEALEIDIEIPDAYATAVTHTRLKVLRPPPDGSLTCETLALADVDPGVVSASTEQELLVARGHARDLTGVARAGEKLLWMQGLDAAGNIVVQGCAHVGEISERTTVTLEAEPTTDVTLPPWHLLHQDTFGGNLVLPFIATLKDVYGTPLAAEEVHVRRLVRGLSTDTREVTDAQGRITVDADLTGHRGPYLLDLRSRWQQAGVEPIVAFAPPRDLATFALDGFVPDYAVLRPGSGGQALLALLIVPEGASVEYLRIVRLDEGPEGPSGPRLPSLVAEVQVYGTERLSIVEHDGVQWAVTIAPDPTCGATCWVELSADGVAAKHPLDVDVNRTLTALLPGGDCALSAAAGPQYAAFEDGTLMQLNAAGQLLEATTAGLPALDFLASGCITDTVATVHRALFAALPADDSGIPVQVIVLPGAPYDPGLWPGLPQGVGFLPPLGGPALLAGAISSDGGIAIDLAELDLTGSDVQLHVRESISTFGPAVDLVGADLDADGIADIAAMIATTDLRGSGTPVLRLLVALGQRYRGQRVAAAWLEQPLITPRLLEGDFDGDGCPDLLVGQRGASPSAVRIISLCQ